jgi:valyl-tRNA synthetase
MGIAVAASTKKTAGALSLIPKRSSINLLNRDTFPGFEGANPQRRTGAGAAKAPWFNRVLRQHDHGINPRVRAPRASCYIENSPLNMQLDKVYEPSRFEPRWAEWWVEQKIYRADDSGERPMFSLVIPPPNVTGSLHMGHMLEHTMIDMVIRWRRMLGFNTLWLPGTDHAGIATQMVVERQLARKKISRHDLGREEFEKKVWEWKAQSGGRIVEQMKRVGASCDWTRERFTMDPGLSRAVREVFVRLWEKGLIYRGEYMIQWCPRCRTALSDLEVAHEDASGSLWHIRYPVKGTDEHLVVATTRPETMLGDTAVAIHPKDARYLHLHGGVVTLPLMNREIPIVCDELADPRFGTGAVKVTPAHDPNDLEAGKRHSLPHVKVIGEDGAMTAEAGAYAGLDRVEARKRVVADLEAQGLLVKIEPHALSVGKCDRCRTVLEPLVSKQWFVRTKPLAEKAVEAVEQGRTKIEPETWRHTYFQWMKNIRDWCVSRQLWWGHRVPAWHCGDCGEVTVSRETPSHCARCHSADLKQDPDVLDTWFSSGLWPFSTLGWPDQTEDLKRFYPTTLMIMGYEILFFWCARMMMLGIEFMGEVPFREVYIHGIVRDGQGRKMSKTRGNTVDPLDIVEKYGTDAVRMALLTSAAPGADILWTEDKLPAARNFCNKMWNAARFLFMNMERSAVAPCIPDSPGVSESLEDRWIRSRLNAAAQVCNQAIEQNRYHEAAQTMWHFFWDEFCDWYIEMKKLRFRENSGLDGHWRQVLTAFEASLRLMHPALPFLTEELWQRLAQGSPAHARSVSLADYPQYDPAAHDGGAERQMGLLQEIITVIRNLRGEMKLDPKAPIAATLYSNREAGTIAGENQEAVEKLANVRLKIVKGRLPAAGPGTRSTNGFEVALEVPAAQVEAQRKRLAKEIERLEKNVANSHRQLGDEKFLARAPEHVVKGIKAKLGDYESQLEKSKAELAALG